jgi:rSAM/selenodomain-associated transferase 1
MARWPAPGRCKRRLAAGLGASRAAAIQARLGLHVIAVAQQAARMEAFTEAAAPSGVEAPFEIVLAVSGLATAAARRWGDRLGVRRVVLQGEGSLGLRLQRQVVRAGREGAPVVALIGSDLPELCAADLRAAFRQLQGSPLVLGPATDGGYWLIGLRGACADLFSGIPWGGDRVLAATLAAARRRGLEATLLKERADLDRPEDLRRWR